MSAVDKPFPAPEQVSVARDKKGAEQGKTAATKSAFGKSQRFPLHDWRALRSTNDIIADLFKPIKARHLWQKIDGGLRVDFIPWYHAIKYLDLYAPGWSYEVRNTVWNTEGRLILTVRLSLPCREGVVFREATRTEAEPEEGEHMRPMPKVWLCAGRRRRNSGWDCTCIIRSALPQNAEIARLQMV